MSASPTNVAFGLMKQMIAGDEEQDAEDRPEPAQRVGDEGEHELLGAGEHEHDPDEDPIVVTDALSNCRMTSAAASHAIPVTSHSHQ